MKKTLYDLTVEMIQFEKFCKDNPDLDEETKKDTLDSVKLPFDKKVIGVAYAMKNVETPIAAIDAEIKRLQEKKSAIKNKAAWLKGYLKESMEATKTDLIESDLIKIRLQNSAPKLEITCEVDELPKGYWTTKTEFVAETTLIKNDLKAGREVKGCYLKPGKHIRIY